MEWTVLLEFEIKLELVKRNRNKATEPNWIVIEMFSALDDLWIAKIINEIYDQ